MKKYKIVGICQIYNEIRKGNLERFVCYFKPLVDEMVVYDDGSTDGSYEYLQQVTPYVIRGSRNDFVNEQSHKQILLNEALKLNPDFLLWLDADEVLTANAAEQLQILCQQCETQNLDGLNFHELNLWRSHSWRRTDSSFDLGWFCRLWRVTPGMAYDGRGPGLHQSPYPSSVRNTLPVNSAAVLHYGFSSQLRLAYKYLVYKSHGQRGYDMLDRLISEERLVLEKVPRELFPQGLWEDDAQPEPLTFAESLAYVEQYKEIVFKPKFSIVCLVYKSVEWLKFVYEQVIKYTDMSDKEFFFVANDANPAVLSYLQDNYLPHYVFHNTPEQQQEWFINNVYRAYNFAAGQARGDFLVLINSDMAFSPRWLDNLWQAYDGSNCLCSRLVEAGKLPSGQYGLSRDFGLDNTSYKEAEFQAYAPSLAEGRVEDGGLYMPLLIRKDWFMMVGGYPEGNIVPGSSLFQPVIALQGQPCISGDEVLIQKFLTQGIRHQTAFASVAYHFQCGESEGVPTTQLPTSAKKVAVCNDLVTGSMGEKVLWDFMLETLPASVGIDMRMVGTQGDYAANARQYIAAHFPEVEVIIQNATFIGTVDDSRYTIAFLQDNLRSMGCPTEHQLSNLQRADKLVTNSVQTALAYPEFEFEIIPVGVDIKLFQPRDKASVRRELGFGFERIGIFVGDFNEVKGWSKVWESIMLHPEITWILVVKSDQKVTAPNVLVYNRIPQPLLAILLNCADFFMLGSPVETQCLSAIEACLCNVPVIMRHVGIFRDFTEEERAMCGIFGEDFEAALQQLPGRSFTPRQVMIEKKLSTQDSMQKWHRLLTEVFSELNIKRIHGVL